VYSDNGTGTYSDALDQALVDRGLAPETTDFAILMGGGSFDAATINNLGTDFLEIYGQNLNFSPTVMEGDGGDASVYITGENIDLYNLVINNTENGVWVTDTADGEINLHDLVFTDSIANNGWSFLTQGHVQNFSPNADIEIWMEENQVSIDLDSDNSNGFTVHGNDLDNWIQASQGNDVVMGGEGDDTIVGIQGDDQLDGQGGDDVLLGDGGNDTLEGGSGNDDLDGGSNDDELHGGSGSDDLDGGFGNDDLYGDSGSDDLDGGHGDDYLNGGSGSDDLDGSVGDDTLAYDPNDSSIDGGSGTDTLVPAGDGADIDLTAVTDGTVTSVEEIDVTGYGANEVTLDPDDVITMSDDTETVVDLGELGLDETTTVTVEGDSEDTINLLDDATPTDDWSETATDEYTYQTQDQGLFGTDVYAEVDVDDDITTGTIQ
ncbi:MAG: calcium-binding protein, partial [Desulfarculaceae bacterium]